MKLNNILGLVQQPGKRPLTYKDMIQSEAKIGGKLFGPIPTGHRREFFCLDERTWVWHEEWLDNSGHSQSKTTRYEVLDDQILKVQNGEYYKIKRDEILNFYEAVKLYNQRIRTELYAHAA